MEDKTVVGVLALVDWLLMDFLYCDNTIKY